MKANELQVIQSVTGTEKMLADTGEITGRVSFDAAAAFFGAVNLNLLYNAYWARKDAIINQQGKTEYIINKAKSYGIDCWCGNSDTALTLEDGYIEIANNNPGITASFIQYIEKFNEFAGKAFTLSALMKDGVLISGTAVIPATITENVDIISAIIPGNIGKFALRLYVDGTASATLWQAGNSICKMAAAKLEPGSRQTVANLDANGNWVPNEPPPKELELAKCQMYQVQTNANVSVVGTGYADTENTAYISFKLPAMRITPTVSFKNLLLISANHRGIYGIPVTSVGALGGGAGFYTGLVYCNGGLTVGEPLILQVRNRDGETGCYFRADANL